MTDRPTRFHLSLSVTQERFEPMVEFYSTLFGTAPVKRKPEYAKFDLHDPSVNFTLNASAQVSHGEINHLGIQVWADETLLAARDRLVKAGLPVREEMGVECCYAGQNKFWVVDPDGRNVEFFRVINDVEHHGRKLVVASGEESACCAPGKSCG